MGCPHLIRDLNFCFMVQILIESTTGQVVRHRQSGSHSSATQRGRSAGTLWYPFYSPSHSFVVRRVALVSFVVLLACVFMF